MPKRKIDPDEAAYIHRISQDLFEHPDPLDRRTGPSAPPSEAERGAAVSLIEQLNAPITPPNTDPESLARWAEFDRQRKDPAYAHAGVSVTTPEEILIDRYLRDYPHTVYHAGQFLRCASGVWQVLPPALFRDEVQRLIETARSAGEVSARAAPRLPRPLAERLRVRLSRPAAGFGPPPANTLPCANGLLDLATGQLRPFTPADGVTATLPYAFTPGARSQVWEAYLQSTVPDCAEFLQEFAGLALTPDTHYELALWLYGPPGAGKSTFLHGLQVLLGARCGPLDMPHLLSGRLDPSLLDGKTLLTCAEPTDLGFAHTARFNALVSGEPFTVTPPYRPAQVIQPRGKLIWAFTTLPRVPAAANPLFRRVRLVPFPAVPEAQQDPSLKPRLAAEGPGLLNWALAGLQRLVARGRFDPPPAVVAATAEFLHDNDLPAQFIEYRYERDPEGRVPAGQLYTAYKKWCLANGHRPAPSNVVSHDWQRLGFERRLSKGLRYWHGLRLPSALPASSALERP